MECLASIHKTLVNGLLEKVVIMIHVIYHNLCHTKQIVPIHRSFSLHSLALQLQVGLPLS